jgi:tRNA pseudouridine55 synthase
MSDGSAAARRPRRAIDGLVLLDKPAGITSNAALQRVKRALNAEKAGHTGTLDPLATGLLPVCLGEATKFSAGMLDAEKGYRAVIELGVTTDTGDREGAVIATGNAPADRGAIEDVIATFRGDIQQRPHRYSAIKRDGRALYSYARAGVDIDVEPRAVRIVELDIVEWQTPLLTIDVLCSKGTYIRSLAEDIGERLGCGAHVAELRRTMVAHLRLDDAVTLDAIEAMPESERDACLLPITRLVQELDAIELDDVEATGFLHGRRIALSSPVVVRAQRRAERERADSSVAVYRRGRREGEPGGDGGASARAAANDDTRGGGTGGVGFLGIATLSADGDRFVLVPTRVIATRAAPGCQDLRQDGMTLDLHE